MRTTKMINQTFTENADGSLTARSYDVGPYETIVLTLANSLTHWRKHAKGNTPK